MNPKIGIKGITKGKADYWSADHMQADNASIGQVRHADLLLLKKIFKSLIHANSINIEALWRQ